MTRRLFCALGIGLLVASPALASQGWIFSAWMYDASEASGIKVINRVFETKARCEQERRAFFEMQERQNRKAAGLPTPAPVGSVQWHECIPTD